MQIVNLSFGKIAYKLFGDLNNKKCAVIEVAMGASCAEWWHLAQKWANDFCVLVYDRAGYGLSDNPINERTPFNISNELNELLQFLKIEKIVLIGHSIGGLYAYQFAQLYSSKIYGLILLDPVSPKNNIFKAKLTNEEYKKSGVDKSINLKIGRFLCSFKLGKLLIPLLKKAPPFYYYNQFTKDEEKYILNHLTNKKTYSTSLKEYSFIEDENKLSSIKIVSECFNFPIFLIFHTPDVMIKEIQYYGNADIETANKIEILWQEIMKEYLKISNCSQLLFAKNSSHLIHLTDDEIIFNTIKKII